MRCILIGHDEFCLNFGLKIPLTWTLTCYDDTLDLYILY